MSLTNNYFHDSKVVENDQLKVIRLAH